MSRIGKLPVQIPKGVSVNLEKNKLTFEGSKGKLTLQLPREIVAEIDDEKIKIVLKGRDQKAKALHGTYRALVANNVKGVEEGWEKTLELVGTGYRVELKGDTLVLLLGFSHPVEIKVPEGIQFKVDKTLITIYGVDKEKVGQIAANIRSIRTPEPYKGKGIRYKDEVVRRKPGKAARAERAGGA